MTKTSTRKYKKEDINKLRIEEIPIHLAKVILYPKEGKPKILEFVDLEPEEEEDLRYNPRNPNKKVLLRVRTKYGDELEIAHYKGNDYLNVFARGGIHTTRFMLTRQNIVELLNALLVYYSILYKEWEKRKEPVLFRIHKQRIKKGKRLIRKCKVE